MIRQKVEVRFEKGEAVRFISHHDLMRAFQRAVRRAGWPVRLTEGYNPRPRIVFPAALEVGIASQDEAAEIELTQWLSLQELKTRLAAHLPAGLALKTLTELAPTRQTRAPLENRYKIHLTEAGLTLTPLALEALQAAPALPFLRIRTDKAGRARQLPVDLKPFLAGAALDAAGDLVVDIRAGPRGSARPLEILSLLCGMERQALKTVRVTKLRMLLAPATEAPPPPPSSPAQKP